MTTAGSGIAIRRERYCAALPYDSCCTRRVRVRVVCVRACVRAHCTRVFKWSRRRLFVKQLLEVAPKPHAERNARSIPPSPCLRYVGDIYTVWQNRSNVGARDCLSLVASTIRGVSLVWGGRVKVSNKNNLSRFMSILQLLHTESLFLSNKYF